MKGGTLCPNPFCPRFRAQKFSAAFGTLSAKQLEGDVAQWPPLTSMSKSMVGVDPRADRRQWHLQSQGFKIFPLLWLVFFKMYCLKYIAIDLLLDM